MTTPTPKPRWYHLTPARLFIGLLVVQVLLLLSGWFQWFWFNEEKGWTVLIAFGVIGVALLVVLVCGLVCLVLRRRFQFGVRSLLVFLVAVSVPMGWLAVELQRARRQREAVEAIVGKGGAVSYDYQYDENGKRIEGAEPTTPEWLRKLLGDDLFCEAVEVAFQGTELGGNDAIHLKVLTKLETLSLSGTQITDNGLVHLREMARLEKLWLGGTQISDSGLAHLEGLTKLEELSFSGTQITNNGLVHLREMTRLELLLLNNTQISDGGLAHLEGLTKLETLSLDGTRVTDEGVKELQKALPNCKIIR